MVRATVIPSPSASLETRFYPYPEVENGSIALRTIASEVCGTDVHLWHGRLAGVPYPLTPGHVSIGEVAETGGPVYDIEGRPVTPGMTVTFLDVHETCFNCWYCLVGKASTRCPDRKVYGITYGAKDGLLGGWSESIYLKPGVKIVPLAKNVTADQWIGGGCGLPTALHATDMAEIKLGDRVLILGAGPVGQSLCALAASSGAGWVGVVDSAENRLNQALNMGADDAIHLNDDIPGKVRAVTGGRGADIVIEASGNPAAVPAGCELVRDGGRFVIVGQYTDHGDIGINPHLHINKKHLEIRGCWGSDLSHVWRSMEVISRFGDRFRWENLITKSYDLDACEQALRDVESRSVVKAVIRPNG